MGFEYKMVQIPQNITVNASEHRGNEAERYLQKVVDRYSSDGWEFYRN